MVSQILRIGHVYGPGEEAYSKLIPSIIKKVLKNDSVTIYGDGSDLRSFIYINDVVEAILASLNLDETIGPVNIASDRSLTIKEVINKIIRIDNSEIKIEKKNRENSKRDLVFDIQKMKEFLHMPQTEFDMGIKLEYEYMREQLR